MTTSSEFLTPEELAERWRMSKETLFKWRSQNHGPPYLKISGVKVLYKMADIEHYEQANTLNN